MRPYVQEIIDLTKQVDDLTSDNVDLKEKLKYMEITEVRVTNDFLSTIDNAEEQKDNLTSVLKLYEKQKDILWEYISEKDVDKISARFNKL